MTEVIQCISSNNLISALVVAAILAIIGKVWTWGLDCRDSKNILDFMLKSKAGTDFTFRSTESIASHTKIAENKVVHLCSKHPRIQRNENEKQSWRVID